MALVGRLLRERRLRRRVTRLRRIKPKLNERRALQALINEMVTTVFQYTDELIAAVERPAPVLVAEDGETIGVLKDAVDDIDRLIQLMVTMTQQVMARLEVRIAEWGQGVNRRHRREFTEAVLVATSIDAGTLLSPDDGNDTVAEYVRWAVSLVRNVGDEARTRMERLVIEAVRNRTPPRELAKSFMEIEGMSRRRAKNIAADQTNKLNNALDRARQREAGIEHFTWRHSGKVHYREHHKAREGKVYEWETPRIRRGDFPGEPPFCGCVAQATIVQDE